MDCVGYSQALLPELTGLINVHIRHVPPGWTLSEQQVATGQASPSPWSIHYPDLNEQIESEILCIVDQGRLVAAAQWYASAQPNPASRSERRVAQVAWIVADPDQPLALKRLLENLMAQARSNDCQALDVGGRYAFGVGWFGIPTVWSHIVAGLQHAGFEPTERWIIMTGSTAVPEVDVPACSPPLRLAWHVHAAALEWNLEAYAGDALVGECEAWGVPSQFAGCEDYVEWIMVEWLGVEAAYQRRGIGRWLLAEQLRRQAERGVVNVVVWTRTDNHAARRVNEALGLRYGPECWRFRSAIK